jgi:hypothetical protein
MTTRIAVTLAAVLAVAQPIHAQMAAPVPAEPIQEVPGPTPMPPPDEGAPLLGPINCADPCEAQWWTSADYLAAWTRGLHLPPLVTTSPAGTAQTAAGVLGQPGTRVLYGDSTVDQDLRWGFRLGFGGWLDPQRTFGIDTDFFMLESRNKPFFASSPGTDIIARPFTDATTRTQTSQLISFPGVSSGGVAASARSNNFYGIHIDGQELLVSGNHYCFIPLIGYRFLQFSDRLSVDTNIVSAGAGGVVPGTQILTSDRFSTRNTFHAGEFGIKAEFFSNRWSLELAPRVAVGQVRRSISINGNTQVTVPGAGPAVTEVGGMLALSPNSGVHISNDWVVSPEVAVNLGWMVNSHLRVRLNYSYLDLNHVAFAPNQATLNLNPNLFPPPRTTGTTPAEPAFRLHKSDIWIQSLGAGLEYRY